MNTLSNSLSHFPKELKILIFCFVCTLSVGFYTGVLYSYTTTSIQPKGIHEQYNGNEEDEDAEVMKFKKSSRDIISIIHSHILSMSMIFAFIGLLVLTTSIPIKLKIFLIIEPFISIIATFGGIYLLWIDIPFSSYIILISGFLMTLVYTISVIVIIRELTKI